LSFIADACAALADAVDEIRIQRRGDAVLVKAYAEMVVAYGQLLRPQLAAQGDVARLAIIDHLVMRLQQAQEGQITMPVQRSWTTPS
jgi:ethanolamine utilization protein EutA (predicted chaperonin)